MNILDILYNTRLMTTIGAALLAFATIITLGLPLIQRSTLSKRLKWVDEQRELMRQRRQSELYARRTNYKTEITGSSLLIKSFVERFNLTRLVGSDDIKMKLTRAGLRGPLPQTIFIFFRFVMPFILFALALLYLYELSNIGWSGTMKLAAAIAAALIGFYLPDLFIANKTTKRQDAIMQSFPDALDLLLICVEAGMSAESAFAKVAKEIGRNSEVLAEELSLTTAELSYLPERSQAFENLAERCGHEGVRAVTTALNQAERYGTPLGHALRICAQESREKRMADAEKKAASLPSKLTVPMILFFLPCLFVIIMSPAMMRVFHTI